MSGRKSKLLRKALAKLSGTAVERRMRRYYAQLSSAGKHEASLYWHRIVSRP